MPTFAPKIAPAAARVPASKPVGAPAPILSPEPASMACEAGGGFDLSHIRALPIQRKASISSPGDAFEREADSVADRVMRMAAPAPRAVAPLAIQRKCAKCEDDDKASIQTKSVSGMTAGASFDTGMATRAIERGGVPLSRELRSYFEPRFGHDFSRVRVHTDGEAAHAALSVQARAYTLGRDIVFGAGQYAPSTSVGRHLLAHELTHVVQQRNGARAVQRRAANCPASEPPQTIITMNDFIGLVRRVEASSSTGSDPIATARLISRTKYDGSAWDWMLPTTKGQAGVVSGGQVTPADVGSLCFKLKVLVPDSLPEIQQEGEEGGKSWKKSGSLADPMHIVVGIVADAETQPAGTGAGGLSQFARALPASVSQRSATTWVGDVGKAAGDWMAIVSLPGGGGATKEDHLQASAPPHDLLADIDGVAMTSKTVGNGFVFDKSKKLSDNLQSYYAPPVAKTGSARRFHVFCRVEGFTLESDGVTLSAAAKKEIGRRVQDFADWYVKNNPAILFHLSASSKSMRFSMALMDRADDWKWFAARFVDYVEQHLKAEGR